MPNWCSTSYRIVGKSEDVADLYSKIQQLQNMEKPLVDNSFGNLWLGCLITILGGDWNKVYCRGHIIDFDLDENKVLSVYTETAWSEMEQVRHFIQQVYTSFKIYYYEEEPGMTIYQTNDKEGRFFTQRYILDDLDGDGPEYYDGIDSLLKAASEAFGKELKTMEELEESVDESDDYSLHCIDVVDD